MIQSPKEKKEQSPTLELILPQRKTGKEGGEVGKASPEGRGAA